MGWGVLEAGKVLRGPVVCGCWLGCVKWRWVCQCAPTCAKIQHTTQSSPTLTLSPGGLGCLRAEPRLGKPGGSSEQGR